MDKRSLTWCALSTNPPRGQSSTTGFFGDHAPLTGSMIKPGLKQAGIIDVTFGENVTVVRSVSLYGCTIGDDSFISHGAMFINDPFVGGGPTTERQLWRATKLGNHVSIGTNTTILPVTICDHVVIGAGAVVTKDITVSGFYVGNPARLLRKL